MDTFIKMGNAMSKYLEITYKYCEPCKDKNCSICIHNEEKTLLDNEYKLSVHLAKGKKQK